jgi:hypothetical protein
VTAVNHGKRWTYDRHGCRCDPCRTARRAYDAKRPNRSGRGTDVDEIAVEKACRGDRSVRLNGVEMAAAFAYLNAHGCSLRQIAERLGVTARTVSRWRSGVTRLPYPQRPPTTRTDVA